MRLFQFVDQVLLDDEWNTVQFLLEYSIPEMFLSFGFYDYSIPFGVFYAWLASHGGLTETLMHLPMLIFGIALLILFPWYVARKLNWKYALLFGFLLAVSPLLITYSRLARPYAITVLLVWVSHVAFLRYWAASTRHDCLLWGAIYVFCGAFAIWLHLLAAPFVVASFLWALIDFFRKPRDFSFRVIFLRWVALGFCLTVVVLALIGPPLYYDASSLTAKSGLRFPQLDTVWGAVYLWLGSTQTWAVLVWLPFLILGAKTCWKLPIVRTGTLGVALTLLAVLISRPEDIHVPIVFARYLLPVVPLLLLLIAVGVIDVHRRLKKLGRLPGTAAAMLLLLPPAVVAASSPLYEQLHFPSANTNDLMFRYDYRADKNRIRLSKQTFPISPFWEALGKQPASDKRIAAAPFSRSSYNWNASFWEKAAHRQVIPALLNGFCAEKRIGELPSSADNRFRFRNAVFLTDLVKKGQHEKEQREAIDWLVWSKPAAQFELPYDRTNMARCEAMIRARFGKPDYEDRWLMAYKLR